MNKRFGPSLYFASDKVIFDALNHSQVKTEVLRDLLFDRGIIASPKTEKQELAKYFSRLPADYFDHKDIANRLGRTVRKERVTYTEIAESLTQEQIVEAANSIKRELEDVGGATAAVSIRPDRIVLEVTYDDIDYTESDFRQVQVKDAFIEFAPAGSTYVVRSTQNHFIDGVVDRVFHELSSVTGNPVSRSRIGLQGIADPAKRTKFFKELTKSIKGHSLLTVNEAFCFKPRAGLSIDEEEKDKELEDQPFVERVGLKGTGVDRSFVVDELYERDYYVVKVAWRVKPDASMDSDAFELEAQFTSPESCTDFSYQVRTAYLFEDGALTTKKRQPKSEEQDALFRLIEQAAKAAMKSLED